MSAYSDREYVIASISFQEEIMEISYFDRENQGERIGMATSLIMRQADFPSEVASIFSECDDLINEGLVILRDPPKELNPRDRLRALKDRDAELTAEDDEELETE